jgi:hypothetical protein
MRNIIETIRLVLLMPLDDAIQLECINKIFWSCWPHFIYARREWRIQLT